MVDWSVKDIRAYVITQEEETLKYLPLNLQGERPPCYAIRYGGIVAFNAWISEQKRAFSLANFLDRLDETHQRLLDYLQSVPEEQFTRDPLSTVDSSY